VSLLDKHVQWLYNLPTCTSRNAASYVAHPIVKYTLRKKERKNVILKAENYVHMSMRMYLPLTHVNLSGDTKRIERIKAQGEVSIDVCKWQIVEIKVDLNRPGGYCPA
jgi:hypothetical protein